MTEPKRAPGYEPNDAYGQEDWDAVSDNPELTDAEIAELRPGSEMPPEILAALTNRGGRPRSAVRKVPVTIRLDPDIVAAFKATGTGWQSRMNDALRKAAPAMAPRRLPR